VGSKEAEKRSRKETWVFRENTSEMETLRVDAWETEWEDIKWDMELHPQNTVQKALLDVLEDTLYSRWLIAYNSRKFEDTSQNADDAEYFFTRNKELPEEETKACQDELFTYRFKLECKFGLIFLTVFSLLTFLPLFLLSFVWGIQYQPLVYLLLIVATTVTYFTPPFERRGSDYVRCYAVPVIVTIHWLVNSGDVLFKTMVCLWLFTTFYYVALHTVIWAVMDRIKKSFDPFGYAYLLTIKNLK
jgi:hypothetical protein